MTTYMVSIETLPEFEKGTPTKSEEGGDVSSKENTLQAIDAQVR
jgi:hypothetical protein